ncbi:MAG TPA: HTH domain-containing protein [Myxococcales bacterium]|nr:HTH domain-containing protein [Myxococcales bacterium]
MRRRERLFAIAEYLRGRRSGVTADALADRFGVTVRTIYRDLDSLRDAELPVRADRGRGGGYALDRAYTLPPVNFTPREAALLVALGAWATGMRLLPFADTLEGALDKVRGALSVSAQRELTELMAGLQFIGVPAPAVPPAVRRAVERAWFERQPLRIRYRSGEGIVTSRAVRIVSAVMDRSLTLLNCDDLEKGERRQFRIDRILEAEVV